MVAIGPVAWPTRCPCLGHPGGSWVVSRVCSHHGADMGVHRYTAQHAAVAPWLAEVREANGAVLTSQAGVLTSAGLSKLMACDTGPAARQTQNSKVDLRVHVMGKLCMLRTLSSRVAMPFKAPQRVRLTSAQDPGGAAPCLCLRLCLSLLHHRCNRSTHLSQPAFPLRTICLTPGRHSGALPLRRCPRHAPIRDLPGPALPAIWCLAERLVTCCRRPRCMCGRCCLFRRPGQRCHRGQPALDCVSRQPVSRCDRLVLLPMSCYLHLYLGAKPVALTGPAATIAGYSRRGRTLHFQVTHVRSRRSAQ